jgi:hypothetical protein
MAAKIAMMAITTNNSIKVKAAGDLRLFKLNLRTYIPALIAGTQSLYTTPPMHFPLRTLQSFAFPNGR